MDHGCADVVSLNPGRVRQFFPDVNNTSTTIHLLRLALNAELDRTSSDALIDLCVRRTTRILIWTSRSNTYRFSKLGLRLEDIAYDIIAELVSDSEIEHCAALRHALMKYPHESDDELVAGFESLLFKNVSKSLSRLFSEINRTQHLLLRSLRYNADLQSDIVFIERLDGRWYLLRSYDDARLHLPGMPQEELRQYLRGTDMNRRPFVMALLNEILGLLDRQDEYRKAVREPDVIQIAMDIIGTQFMGMIERDESENDAIDTDVNLQIYERCLQKALDISRVRVEESHGNRNFLSPHDLAAFLEAAGNYMRDDFQGRQGSRYSYLCIAMPGLTNRRYREDYRNRFEHFLRKLAEDVSILMKKLHEEAQG